MVCVTANYTKEADGHIAFNNTAHNCKTNVTQSIFGDVERNDDKLTTDAKFAVKYSTLDPRTNYDVVMTDYQTALVLLPTAPNCIFGA
ncbi:unnamed protein product [Sphagnum balticum]